MTPSVDAPADTHPSDATDITFNKPSSNAKWLATTTQLNGESSTCHTAWEF